MKDRDVKLTKEHPALDLKHVARVIVRQGLQPVTSKKSISLRVDAGVPAWFRAQGPGYQTRINVAWNRLLGHGAIKRSERRI